MKKKPLNCFIVKMDGKYKIVDIDLSNYKDKDFRLERYICNALYDGALAYIEDSILKNIVIITDDCCPGGNWDYKNLACGEISRNYHISCDGNVAILRKKKFKSYELKEENYRRLTKRDIKKISKLLDESCRKYYDKWERNFKGFDYWIAPEEIE